MSKWAWCFSCNYNELFYTNFVLDDGEEVDLCETCANKIGVVA